MEELKLSSAESTFPDIALFNHIESTYGSGFSKPVYQEAMERMEYDEYVACKMSYLRGKTWYITEAGLKILEVEESDRKTTVERYQKLFNDSEPCKYAESKQLPVLSTESPHPIH